MDSTPEAAKAEASPEKPRPTLGGRVKSALRKAGMLGLSLLIAGSMGECAVRLTGKHFESSLHTPDPDLGWAFRPGARGWSTLEGRAYITINDDGSNDRDHAIDKPKDTIRIAVIGDSFTGNYNVPREQSYWSVMERKLAECPALGQRKVEVLAFGTGGYGTAQELILLRKKIWKYRPDIVLLQFFGGNDIIDNKREVMQEKANEPPYYLLQGNELVLDDSFKKKVPGPATLWMRNTFADAMNHIELALLLKLAVGARQRAKTHILTSHPKDLGYPDRYAFETPTEPNVIEAWRVTEALLHQMAKEVHESGAEFRMMAVSSPQQVHPDVSEREEFRKVLGMPNLFYAEERLAKIADKEGFAFLSLPQPMADYAAKNNVFLHGFPNAITWGGHWNENGHRVAGELLAADYCKRFEAPALTPGTPGTPGTGAPAAPSAPTP